MRYWLAVIRVAIGGGKGGLVERNVLSPLRLVFVTSLIYEKKLL